MKLNTFFISNTRDIYSKLSRFSESSVKVKVWSHWTFLIFSLQLFARKDFWNLMRLCNILKTTNAIALTDIIVEKIYTVVQSS